MGVALATALHHRTPGLKKLGAMRHLRLVAQRWPLAFS